MASIGSSITNSFTMRGTLVCLLCSVVLCLRKLRLRVHGFGVRFMFAVVHDPAGQGDKVHFFYGGTVK